MKSVLVIGLGRFGRHICMDLTQLKHEVMAVDKNEDCVNAVLPFVTSGIIGDSTREEFLRSLGISNYDLCIVAIGDDFQSSLETTCLLKELGAKEVVSRASRDVHAKFLLRNGADHVVYPEKQLADWTAIRYSSDMISDYFELNEDYSLFELKIPDAWVGMSIGKLDIRKKYKINILGFKHGNEFNLETTPDMVFKSGETMLVVGRNQDIQKCFHL
ncbi:trk system potassium uptake protein TrkA [Oribacterium sp. KHPX15]|uniref:potassium channel family protein n=1 Tax=Oribacterium sp. KHPX15 TaxID=1855342 RepID=UPI00089A8183|nr:TrkA family potassium uptake protein [Oribacterium sp. KHPX15]SEA61567.1 trk system potassium uptake protein TrkA [Oribacterium sp. KHPX15]